MLHIGETNRVDPKPNSKYFSVPGSWLDKPQEGHENIVLKPTRNGADGERHDQQAWNGPYVRDSWKIGDYGWLDQCTYGVQKPGSKGRKAERLRPLHSRMSETNPPLRIGNQR